MKLFPRLHTILVLAICSTLYVAWIYPSLHVTTRIQKAWSRTNRRVVVFGDSWSDTGVYLMAPPADAVERLPEQGSMWTETLCKELVCDFVDNFARSTAWHGDNRGGAVIDNRLFANRTGQDEAVSEPLADFQTQVQQWLNFEKQKRLVSGREVKDEWTVFTVQFGLWDIWHYSTMDKEPAKEAIDRSTDEIFRQLDIIAEKASKPVRIVLPTLVDLTFLPYFKTRSEGGAFAVDQHQTVFMVEYFNQRMAQRAAIWTCGIIIMPDVNKWMVDHVREKQLYMLGIVDSAGAGRAKPTFDKVERPCLSWTEPDPEEDREDITMAVQGAKPWQCIDPSTHLFWDGMHLGGAAHRLIGKAIAEMVHGNHSFNEGAFHTGSFLNRLSQFQPIGRLPP